MVDASEKDIQVVRKWLDGGCPSWGVPVDQIRKLCSARAEAQLAEVRKALEEAREVVDACAGDNRPARAWAITVRDGIDGALAALRALTGGQENG